MMFVMSADVSPYSEGFVFRPFQPVFFFLPTTLNQVVLERARELFVSEYSKSAR